MSLLLAQFRQFSRANGWIYPVFIVLWLVVLVTERGSPVEVAVVFAVHLTGEILLMAAMYEDSRGYYREAAPYLLASSTVFGGISVSAVLMHGEWQYLLAQAVIIVSSLLSYGRHRGWRLADYAVPIALALSVAAVGVEIVYALVPTTSGLAQMLSVLGMGISFAMRAGKWRYLLFLLSDIVLIGASVMEIDLGWTHGAISGVSVSYTLFPIVAFFFFAGLWGSFFGKR